MAPRSRPLARVAAAGVLAFGLATVAAITPSVARNDVAAGRSLSIATCAYCHVVAADQGFKPVLRPLGPDFQVIADNPKTDAGRLRSFMLEPHKDNEAGMSNVILDNDQVSDIAAYILSLRAKP